MITIRSTTDAATRPRHLGRRLGAAALLAGAVALNSGDSIRFVNDTHPSLVSVESVSVTISGATQHAFTLPAGAAATVGPYTGTPAPGQPIRYTATYHAALVNGLVPAGSHQESGTITVEPATNPPTAPCQPHVV